MDRFTQTIESQVTGSSRLSVEPKQDAEDIAQNRVSIRAPQTFLSHIVSDGPTASLFHEASHGLATTDGLPSDVGLSTSRASPFSSRGYYAESSAAPTDLSVTPCLPPSKSDVIRPRSLSQHGSNKNTQPSAFATAPTDIQASNRDHNNSFKHTVVTDAALGVANRAPEARITQATTNTNTNPYRYYSSNVFVRIPVPSSTHNLDSSQSPHAEIPPYHLSSESPMDARVPPPATILPQTTACRTFSPRYREEYYGREYEGTSITYAPRFDAAHEAHVDTEDQSHLNVIDTRYGGTLNAQNISSPDVNNADPQPCLHQHQYHFNQHHLPRQHYRQQHEQHYCDMRVASAPHHLVSDTPTPASPSPPPGPHSFPHIPMRNPTHDCTHLASRRSYHHSTLPTSSLHSPRRRLPGYTSLMHQYEQDGQAHDGDYACANTTAPHSPHPHISLPRTASSYTSPHASSRASYSSAAHSHVFHFSPAHSQNTALSHHPAPILLPSYSGSCSARASCPPNTAASMHVARSTTAPPPQLLPASSAYPTPAPALAASSPINSLTSLTSPTPGLALTSHTPLLSTVNSPIPTLLGCASSHSRVRPRDEDERPVPPSPEPKKAMTAAMHARTAAESANVLVSPWRREDGPSGVQGYIGTCGQHTVSVYEADDVAAMSNVEAADGVEDGAVLRAPYDSGMDSTIANAIKRTTDRCTVVKSDARQREGACTVREVEVNVSGDANTNQVTVANQISRVEEVDLDVRRNASSRETVDGVRNIPANVHHVGAYLDGNLSEVEADADCEANTHEADVRWLRAATHRSDVYAGLDGAALATRDGAAAAAHATSGAPATVAGIVCVAPDEGTETMSDGYGVAFAASSVASGEDYTAYDGHYIATDGHYVASGNHHIATGEHYVASGSRHVPTDGHYTAPNGYLAADGRYVVPLHPIPRCLTTSTSSCLSLVTSIFAPTQPLPAATDVAVQEPVAARRGLFTRNRYLSSLRPSNTTIDAHDARDMGDGHNPNDAYNVSNTDTVDTTNTTNTADSQNTAKNTGLSQSTAPTQNNGGCDVSAAVTGDSTVAGNGFEADVKHAKVGLHARMLVRPLTPQRFRSCDHEDKENEDNKERHEEGSKGEASGQEEDVCNPVMRVGVDTNEDEVHFTPPRLWSVCRPQTPVRTHESPTRAYAQTTGAEDAAQSVDGAAFKYEVVNDGQDEEKGEAELGRRGGLRTCKEQTGEQRCEEKGENKEEREDVEWSKKEGKGNSNEKSERGEQVREGSVKGEWARRAMNNGATCDKNGSSSTGNAGAGRSIGCSGATDELEDGATRHNMTHPYSGPSCQKRLSAQFAVERHSHSFSLTAETCSYSLSPAASDHSRSLYRPEEGHCSYLSPSRLSSISRASLRSTHGHDGRQPPQRAVPLDIIGGGEGGLARGADSHDASGNGHVGDRVITTCRTDMDDTTFKASLDPPPTLAYSALPLLETHASISTLPASSLQPPPSLHTSAHLLPPVPPSLPAHTSTATLELLPHGTGTSAPPIDAFLPLPSSHLPALPTRPHPAAVLVNAGAVASNSATAASTHASHPSSLIDTGTVSSSTSVSCLTTPCNYHGLSRQSISVAAKDTPDESRGINTSSSVSIAASTYTSITAMTEHGIQEKAKDQIPNLEIPNVELPLPDSVIPEIHIPMPPDRHRVDLFSSHPSYDHEIPCHSTSNDTISNNDSSSYNNSVSFDDSIPSAITTNTDTDIIVDTSGLVMAPSHRCDNMADSATCLDDSTISGSTTAMYDDASVRRRHAPAKHDYLSLVDTHRRGDSSGDVSVGVDGLSAMADHDGVYHNIGDRVGGNSHVSIDTNMSIDDIGSVKDSTIGGDRASPTPRKSISIDATTRPQPWQSANATPYKHTTVDTSACSRLWCSSPITYTVTRRRQSNGNDFGSAHCNANVGARSTIEKQGEGERVRGQVECGGEVSCSSSDDDSGIEMGMDFGAIELCVPVPGCSDTGSVYTRTASRSAVFDPSNSSHIDANHSGTLRCTSAGPYACDPCSTMPPSVAHTYASNTHRHVGDGSLWTCTDRSRLCDSPPCVDASDDCHHHRCPHRYPSTDIDIHMSTSMDKKHVNTETQSMSAQSTRTSRRRSFAVVVEARSLMGEARSRLQSQSVCMFSRDGAEVADGERSRVMQSVRGIELESKRKGEGEGVCGLRYTGEVYCDSGGDCAYRHAENSGDHRYDANSNAGCCCCCGEDTDNATESMGTSSPIDGVEPYTGDMSVVDMSMDETTSRRRGRGALGTVLARSTSSPHLTPRVTTSTPRGSETVNAQSRGKSTYGGWGRGERSWEASGAATTTPRGNNVISATPTASTAMPAGTTAVLSRTLTADTLSNTASAASIAPTTTFSTDMPLTTAAFVRLEQQLQAKGMKPAATTTTPVSASASTPTAASMSSCTTTPVIVLASTSVTNTSIPTVPVAAHASTRSESSPASLPAPVFAVPLPPPLLPRTSTSTSTSMPVAIATSTRTSTVRGRRQYMPSHLSCGHAHKCNHSNGGTRVRARTEAAAVPRVRMGATSRAASPMTSDNTGDGDGVSRRSGLQPRYCVSASPPTSKISGCTHATRTLSCAATHAAAASICTSTHMLQRVAGARPTISSSTSAAAPMPGPAEMGERGGGFYTQFELRPYAGKTCTAANNATRPFAGDAHMTDNANTSTNNRDNTDNTIDNIDITSSGRTLDRHTSGFHLNSPFSRGPGTDSRHLCMDDEMYDSRLGLSDDDSLQTNIPVDQDGDAMHDTPADDYKHGDDNNNDRHAVETHHAHHSRALPRRASNQTSTVVSTFSRASTRTHVTIAKDHEISHQCMPPPTRVTVPHNLPQCSSRYSNVHDDDGIILGQDNSLTMNTDTNTDLVTSTSTCTANSTSTNTKNNNDKNGDIDTADAISPMITSSSILTSALLLPSAAIASFSLLDSSTHPVSSPLSPAAAPLLPPPHLPQRSSRYSEAPASPPLHSDGDYMQPLRSDRGAADLLHSLTAHTLPLHSGEVALLPASDAGDHIDHGYQPQLHVRSRTPFHSRRVHVHSRLAAYHSHGELFHRLSPQPSITTVPDAADAAEIAHGILTGIDNNGEIRTEVSFMPFLGSQPCFPRRRASRPALPSSMQVIRGDDYRACLQPSLHDLRCYRSSYDDPHYPHHCCDNSKHCCIHHDNHRHRYCGHYQLNCDDNHDKDYICESASIDSTSTHADTCMDARETTCTPTDTVAVAVGISAPAEVTSVAPVFKDINTPVDAMQYAIGIANALPPASAGTSSVFPRPSAVPYTNTGTDSVLPPASIPDNTASVMTSPSMSARSIFPSASITTLSILPPASIPCSRTRYSEGEEGLVHTHAREDSHNMG